jgi:hypothetical protein
LVDVTEQIGGSEPVGLNGPRPHHRVASLGHIASTRLMPIALNLTDFVRARGGYRRFDDLEHIQSTGLCELDGA